MNRAEVMLLMFSLLADCTGEGLPTHHQFGRVASMQYFTDHKTNEHTSLPGERGCLSWEAGERNLFMYLVALGWLGLEPGPGPPSTRLSLALDWFFLS